VRVDACSPLDGPACAPSAACLEGVTRQGWKRGTRCSHGRLA
jgi:hypothetical protein